MLPALAVLACVLPPSVFAAFRPHTPKWRAARKVYWVSFPVAAAWFAVNLALVDPAGPPAVYYGMWLGFVIVASLWAWSAGVVRSEWSEWRRRVRRERELAAGPKDPSKPWLR